MRARRRQSSDEIAPHDLRRLCPKGCIPRRLLGCRLPPILPGTTLAELKLPCRARKLFERRRYVERPAAAAKLTIGQLVKTRGLGGYSIIAIVEALYRSAKARGFACPALASSDGQKPRAAEFAPRNLRRHVRQLRTIPSEFLDCRLPPLPPDAALSDLRLSGRALRFIQSNSQLERPQTLAEATLADLLGQAGIGALTVVEIVEALYRLAQGRREHTTLDEELLGWLVPKGQPLRRRIVSERLGLNGRQARRLAAIGASYGITRERVRQLCIPRTPPPTSLSRRFQTVVDAARALLPAPAADVETRLASQGLLERRTSLAAILRVARLLDCEAGFVLEGKRPNCLARAPLSDTTVRLQELLMRLSFASPLMHAPCVLTRWNAAGHTPLDLAAIEEAVEATRRARWLDRTSGWFWFERRGSALRRRINKALAAAGRLTIAELEAAVWRGPRTKDWPRPPSDVLREFCRQLPECRVEEEVVLPADSQQSLAVLRGEEKKLVEFLQLCGRACAVEELLDFASFQGISEAMLRQLLLGSPALQRYGRSHYGVPGL